MAPMLGPSTLAAPRRRTAGLAFSATLLGLVFAAFFGLSILTFRGEESCLNQLEERPPVARGEVVRAEPSLWPLGLRCVYRAPDGREASRIETRTPLDRWGLIFGLGCTVVFGALGAWVFSQDRRRRSYAPV
jgi:hypothetical protein